MLGSLNRLITLSNCFESKKVKMRSQEQKCICFAYRDFPSSLLVAFKGKKDHISLEKGVVTAFKVFKTNPLSDACISSTNSFLCSYRITNFNSIWVTKPKNKHRFKHKSYQSNCINCITFSRAMFIFSVRPTLEAIVLGSSKCVNTILVELSSLKKVHWTSNLMDNISFPTLKLKT